MSFPCSGVYNPGSHIAVFKNRVLFLRAVLGSQQNRVENTKTSHIPSASPQQLPLLSTSHTSRTYTDTSLSFKVHRLH